MSFKHLSPEKRKAMAEKSAATRRAKKEARETEETKARLSEMAAFGSASAALRLQRMEEKEAAEEAYLKTPFTQADVEERRNFPSPFPPPGIAPSELAVDPEPDADDPFSLFLLGLPASTREALSLAELRDIYASNVAKAEAEKKAVAKKAASEIASNTARMQAGLVPMATQAEMDTSRRNAELVRWTCELPPAGDQGEIADDGLRIDGNLLRHGSVHILTRAQYDSYREMIYRASEHELTFKGQGRRQRQWLLGRALGGSIT